MRDALIGIARRVEGRNAAGVMRLPIDRAFSLKGFGTVVTGTLVSGRLRVEDEVEVHPGGRRLRVRGVQVHGGAVEAAEAGQRTAVNLANVEAAELRRGMVLGPVGLFRTTQVADCRFDLLATAQPLKHGAPIHLHAGTAEVEAEVRMLRGAGALEPGTSGFVRLRLREPLLLLPGDRFIARMFSPVVTIGGGEVIDNAPAAGMKRAAALDRLPELWRAGLEKQLSLWAAEEEAGSGVAELAARAGVREGEVLAAAEGAGLVAVKGEALRLVARAAVEGVVAKLRAELGRFHRENPLLPGMPKASAPAAAWLVEAALGRTAEIVAEGENLRLRAFQPKMQAEEDAAAGKMEELFREGGLAVPGVVEVLGQSGLDANRSRTVLQLLLREGRLVRISAELIYHREAVERLRGLLGEKKGMRFGVAEFKEWTGVSRKYAIPLLEWLDRERVTRREGEKRLIL